MDVVTDAARRPVVLLVLLGPVLLLLLEILPGHGPALTAVRAVVALPSVLLAPGVLALAAVRRGRRGLLGAADAASVSVGAVVVLGLLLNAMSVPLRPLTWSAGLVLVCAAAAAPVAVRGTASPGARPAGYGTAAVMIAELVLLFAVAAWVSVHTTSQLERAQAPLELSAQRAEDGRAVITLSTRAPADQQVVVEVRRGVAPANVYQVHVRAGSPWTLPVVTSTGVEAVVRARTGAPALRTVRLAALRATP